MKLSPLQQLVAQHYAGSEFAHVVDTDELDDLGDTLFKFVVLEAGDADCGSNTILSAHTFGRMLETAINQLRSLQSEIVGEI